MEDIADEPEPKKVESESEEEIESDLGKTHYNKIVVFSRHNLDTTFTFFVDLEDLGGIISNEEEYSLDMGDDGVEVLFLFCSLWLNIF